MANGGKFFLGAAIGAAVGVVTGILTAPKSGKETRADIKKKAGEVKDVAGEKYSAVKDKVGQVTDDAMDKAGDFKEHAENAVQGAKDGFKRPLGK